MKLILIAILCSFILSVTGCSEEAPETVYVEILANCDDVGEADVELDGGFEDVGPELVEDAFTPEDVAIDVEEDIQIEADPKGSGETDGNAIIFSQEAFEGLYIYGLGTEPGTALSQVGNTVTGAIAIPAVIELDDGLFKVRVYDMETNSPVPGGNGVVEAYAAEELEDGRIKVDFGEPSIPVEIQLWQNCVYALQSYFLAGEPLFADGLLTWASLEHYQSEKCGGQGLPDAIGTNVHFLRRMDANPDFLPRKVDPDSAFGFFEAQVGDDRFLDRMPHTGAFYADEKVIYHLSVEFPTDLRQVAYDVVEHWNDTLEEKVGNRPLKLVEGDASLIPWDPRFRVIQWDDSKSSGAIAPFIENPMTGEMFETDVIMWLGGLEDLVAKYQDFFNTFPDAPIGDFQPQGMAAQAPMEFQKLPIDWNDARGLPPRVIRRRSFPMKPFGVQELHKIAQSASMSLGPDELAEFIVSDFLTHEIGHNFGLRHNFKASVDRDHHPETDTSTSTMDYVVGMTSPGTYDGDAMAYGYGEGSEENGYLFCTDEDVELDPGCVRWDYGHPVLYALYQLDKLAADYPADTPTEELQNMAEALEWGKLFNRTRQFFNTDYENWEPDVPVKTYMELVDRVVCATEEEEECATHLWFRQEWALYTLYSKWNYQGDWVDFPALESDDAEKLMGHYYVLILDPQQNKELKKTIIDKLPTANVEGAEGLLQTLLAYLNTLEEPTADQEELLSWVKDAANN
jgi:hypothetical protein